jgi:hypothetical protein
MCRFLNKCLCKIGLHWHDLAAFLAFFAITLAMTYPLAFQLSTHAAGSGNDMWIYHWGNWWTRKVLTEGGDLYWTPYMFYPYGVSLRWYGFSWANTALWLVLSPFIGSLAAHNITVLLTYALSACTAYLLAREVTGSRWAAVIAGLVFAFSPAHHAYRNQLNFSTIQWMPLSALYLVRIGRYGRWRDGIGAGISFALCALSGERLLLLILLWASLWLAYSLATERHLWSIGTLKALGLAVLICLVLAGPLLAPLVIGVLDPETSQDLEASGVDEKNADLLSYFVPSRYHPLITEKTPVKTLYKQWVHVSGRPAAIGYSVLALVVWAVLKRWRDARLWVLSALVCVTFALGSWLRFNGQGLGIPLPYWLLASTPVGTAMRNPERFNILLNLPVAVLAAIGISDLLGRLSARRVLQSLVIACMPALVLFEYVAVPFPTTRPVYSPFYKQLREEAGEFAIADFPIGFHAHDKWYLYAQTLHERPIVGGNVARVPANAFAFIDQVPLLSAALVNPPAKGELDDVTRQLAPLVENNVRYVVIHKYRTSVGNMSAWREWFAFQPYYEDGYLLVYRTAPQYGEDFEIVAKVGDGVGIVRSSLSTTVLAKGDLLEAEVVWGTNASPQRDWQARLSLVGSSGEQAQWADFDPCAGWPASEWGGNAIARGRAVLKVTPFIEGGTYQVVVEFLDAETGERAGDSVVLGEVEVQAVERSFVAPDAEVETDVQFGDDLRLVGYDLAVTSDAIDVVLHWQALGRMQEYYKFFVHLYDLESGALVAQADVVPRNWTYPTTWWETGEFVSDEITLPLEGIPSGAYSLYVGVYKTDGERLSVSSGGDRYVLKDQMVLPKVP